jgi:hypothetical protein
LALLSDLSGIDVKQLNDDMLSGGKYPGFKRGLYMNLVSYMNGYANNQEFYKEYKIRDDVDSPMTNDVIKMIGSIYEAVGSRLIAGRKTETELEEYFDVPQEVQQLLRYNNL